MNRFKVGDEVVYKTTTTKFVITSIDENGNLNGIGLNGVAFCDKNKNNWKKTGRHFIEAERLMEALKKSEEKPITKETKGTTYYVC